MQRNSVNKVILIGNLGQDPEARFTPQGTAVVNLSVATNESWKDQSGEVQERTEWHRVVMYGRMAETADKYMKKGQMVYVEGRLQTRQWEDKEGQRRYTTEVIAQDIQFLDRGDADGFDGRSSGTSTENSGHSPDSDGSEGSIDPNDLPFE